MKKMFLTTFLISLFPVLLSAQSVNGIIYSDTAGILVVKIWGTHQERGYALGYLTGDRITDVILNYVKPEFGPFYTLARNTILQGNDLSIPTDYNDEAQAIIDGMDAAGFNTGNLDKTDILVGNTFLDITNLLSLNMGMNCSALMSWNDATAGTDLNGTSVVTRHLDWEYSTVLNRNHIVTVHFPSEAGEHKWLLTGFSGMMSVLSGFNPDFSAFQNMMDDYPTPGLHNKQYMPIWFALRKALEAEDYNGDGNRDVMDVRSALQDCPNGFADGFIISALARSHPVDSLVALVAELAATNPTHTFRSSSYPDSIPGDNLYTANYQIARNNLMHFCSRYNGIRNHIGNGTMISTDTSWNLMRDWSHLPNNIQFMQYAPEVDLFRLSVRTGTSLPYQIEPVTFSINDLFDNPATGTGDVKTSPVVVCSFNRQSGTIEIRANDQLQSAQVFDLTGRTAAMVSPDNTRQLFIPVTDWPTGIYLVRLTTSAGTVVRKVFVGD